MKIRAKNLRDNTGFEENKEEEGKIEEGKVEQRDGNEKGES